MEHYVSLEEEVKKGKNLNYFHADSYLDRFHQEKKDFSRLLPATTFRTFPKSGFEWLYGWTYRDGTINIREDLQGERKQEVVVHESIHTSDEYETRRLTEWIMEGMFPQEKKYSTQPPQYKS